MKKSLIMTFVLMFTLILGACGREDPTAPQTATSVPVVTISLGVEEGSEDNTEVTEDPIEAVEVRTYKLQDCFAECAEIVDTMDELSAYIDSYDGITIRAYAGKRVFPDNTSSDLENSVSETIFNYTTFAGMEKRRIEVPDTDDVKDIIALNVYNVDGDNNCVPFEDAYGIIFSEEDKLSDMYKHVLKGVGLDRYANTMFMTANSEITKESADKITYDIEHNGSCRIESNYPADVVCQILGLTDDVKEIVTGYLSYDLAAENSITAANEPADSIIRFVPTYISGFLQYINNDDKMVAYSINVIYVPSSYSDIAEWVEDSCGCGGGCACGCDEIDAFTFMDMDATKYVKATMNARDLPSTDGEVVCSLQKGEKIYITGMCLETGWFKFDHNGQTVYGSDDLLVDSVN